MKSTHNLLTRDKVNNVLAIRFFHTVNEVQSFKSYSLTTWSPLDFYDRIHQNKIYARHETSRTVMSEHTGTIYLLWRKMRIWKK